MSDPNPGTSSSLVHLVRESQAASDIKSPLLILLHGIGSNERDLFSFADMLDPYCTIVCPRAPMAYGVGGFSWFDIDLRPGSFVADPVQVRASLDRLRDFIDEVTARYDADPRHILLGGFSQGGFMALLAALSQPHRMAGVVSMSGMLTPEVEPLIASPAALQGFPVLMTHGIHDGIIPIAYARHTRDVLQKLPVDLAYHEYDMGHEVNMASLAVVMSWTSMQLGHGQ